MRTRSALPTLLALTLAAALSSAAAKDQDVTLEQCPPPVQAVIRHYSKQATLEQIGLDEKKKSGGPAVYEARFAMKDGNKVEVHISPEGSVLQIETKKAKK